MDVAVGIATMVVALIAIAGLIFNAGKMSNRLEHQEQWRMEHLGNHETWDQERRDDLEKIYAKIDNLWGQKFGK